MTYNWKKATIIVLDILMGVYLVLAVTAFNKPDESAQVCKELHITIQKEVVEGFLTTDKVKQMLHKHHVYPVSQPMDQVNVRLIEETLQSSQLIDHAECYKTQTGRVCIEIRQRIPIVRVMAQNGDDYFVDSRGEVMPRNGYSCNTLVATGSITKAYARKHLASLARTIVANEFWKNQIVQINVLHDGSVELVPRVGEHVAYLGQPVGVERKLDRLFKFYRYGLSQAGWNHYSRVSVEFDNQIVCKRRPKGKS